MTLQAELRKVGFRETRTVVKWPRKRFYRTIGVVRDIKTGEKVGKK